MPPGAGTTFDMALVRAHDQGAGAPLGRRGPWIASALVHGATLMIVALGLIETRSPSVRPPAVIEIELVAAAPSLAAAPAPSPPTAPSEEVRKVEATPVAIPTVATEAPPAAPPRPRPAVRRPVPAAAPAPVSSELTAEALPANAPTAAPVPPRLAALPPAVGRPGADADYFAAILAWLERHKEYPRQAQIRRQQGTVVLKFELDRLGHVLSHRIQASSGFPELDREVEAMIRRAEPLPPMPAEMTEAKLELLVPVQFRLR